MLLAVGADLHAAAPVKATGPWVPHLAGGSGPAFSSTPEGATPLVMALAGGHTALAEFLLNQGANPNAADVWFSALHYAVWGEDMLDLVEELLARGAIPDARVVREPPLGLIRLLGGKRFNLFATAQGSALDKDHSPSWLGATPLWLAAQIGNVDAMRVLIAAGADPMMPTEEGTTPLLAAAGVGRIVGFFEENRISADLEGRSNLEAVELLLKLGSDVNAVGQNGWTALHGAASTGEGGIIELLVKAGAKLDAMSNFGETPLSTALAYPTEGLNAPDVDIILSLGHQLHEDIADLLLRLGATPLEQSGVRRVRSGTPASVREPLNP